MQKSEQMFVELEMIWFVGDMVIPKKRCSS